MNTKSHEYFVATNRPLHLGTQPKRVRAVHSALMAVAQFADAHEREGLGSIGADYVAAPIMAEMLRGVVHMLNYDVRPIEAATLDRLARGLATRIGLTEDFEVQS